MGELVQRRLVRRLPGPSGSSRAGRESEASHSEASLDGLVEDGDGPWSGQRVGPHRRGQASALNVDEDDGVETWMRVYTEERENVPGTRVRSHAISQRELPCQVESRPGPRSPGRSAASESAASLTLVGRPPPHRTPWAAGLRDAACDSASTVDRQKGRVAQPAAVALGRQLLPPVVAVRRCLVCCATEASLGERP
ncbi:hypothetical protein CDD83_8914 [Cordyceps sp. RAO-2017]|nr:hypothetical protein CDD83_8914 [Cordyceps sp. RAO-2017]